MFFPPILRGKKIFEDQKTRFLCFRITEIRTLDNNVNDYYNLKIDLIFEDMKDYAVLQEDPVGKI